MVKYERLVELLSGQKNVPDRPWAYGDLLKLKFWKERKNQILLRDKNTCTICGLQGTIVERNLNKEGFAYKTIETSTRQIPENPDYEITIDDINSMRVIYIPTEPVVLHVHHHYYLLDSLPWEYNNKVLITYCSHCHHKWHRENKAIVYQKVGGKYYKRILTPCERCNGVGSLEQFDYYMDGICFKCFGARYNELIEYCKPPKNNDSPKD